MDRIIELYQEGKSYKQISQECSCSEYTVWNRMKKSGLTMRGSGNSKPPKQNPFETFSRESMYWLGYIIADGNITATRLNATLVLFSKDREILEKYNQFTGGLCKIHIWNKQNVYGARLHSKSICNWLIEVCGIIPNKSLVVDPKLNITWDLLRGYFDGDGSIRLGGTRKESKFTTGSLIWAERISEFLLDNNIHNVITQKGNAYDVNLYRKSDSEKLYRKMYEDTDLYLQYKYDRFVALFSNE